MKLIVIVSALSFLLFSCQTENIEGEISQIEEIIGIETVLNKHSKAQRLSTIKEVLSQKKEYKIKYAFAALREDTISTADNFQANLVLATLPDRLNTKLYYRYKGKLDSSDFHDKVDVFSLLLKPDTAGDHSVQGYIRDSKQNLEYPFKLFFHVR
jgi:hypothetical protein